MKGIMIHEYSMLSGADGGNVGSKTISSRKIRIVFFMQGNCVVLGRDFASCWIL